MHYDVFNGDADGICALIQLRLDQPRESRLVTGVKRDINLLKQVDASVGDSITVLDVSFDQNTADAYRLLDAGASMFYADHHQANNLQEHPRLRPHINTDANMCTSLIINQLLGAKFNAWAITAAFGDNLIDEAHRLCSNAGYSSVQEELLSKLGCCINYNGYGSTEKDLFFHPAELYRLMSSYDTPFAFATACPGIVNALFEGYSNDMEQASMLLPMYANSNVALFVLPNKQWARRVNGVYNNSLANASPKRAHAVLIEKPNGSYQVSVRAPLNNKIGADQLVSQFATGGGRKAAAGINELPQAELDRFILAFAKQYPIHGDK